MITIFSAPNYCDVYNNKGAVIKFENNTLNIQQFNYTQHPYLLPHFMDIFSWSIPFVSEKVTEMLYNLVKIGEELKDDEELNETDFNEIKKYSNTQKPTIPEVKGQPKDKFKKKADVLRSKIKFVSKMMIMQKTLRQENENIMKLKGQCPDNKIPHGLLLGGTNAI